MTAYNEIVFFKNQTSNGVSNSKRFIGGRLNLVADGTFDGATLKFLVSYNEGNFVKYLEDGDTEISITVPGQIGQILEDSEVDIQAELSTVGASTNVTVKGFFIPRTKKAR